MSGAPQRSIALIGPGRLGQTVAHLLHEAGYPIRAIIGRDPGRATMAAHFAGCSGVGSSDLAQVAGAELVLLAVPDAALAPLADELRQRRLLGPETVLVHFSGLHPAALLLEPDQPEGNALSLHPLQTFASAPIGVRTLPGSPIILEGPDRLLPLAKELALALGGIPVPLESAQKPLYHAAACLVSNYLVVLVQAAAEALAGCGLDPDSAPRLLGPLLQGTLKNLLALGPSQALTGPISRGDVATVDAHLQALTALPAELEGLYRVLGRKALVMAEARGSLTPAQGDALRQLLG